MHHPASALQRSMFVLTTALAIAAPVAAEQYTFGVEPSFPPEQAQEVYKPLLDYLQQQTGHEFTLEIARNYHFHWRELRQNAKVDFVFEEAHFVDYRAQRFGFQPLVRTGNPSIYTLLASEEFADGDKNSLIGRRIVSMPAPSLGFAVLVEIYANPISQPEFLSDARSWHDGVQMVFGGDAEAAMVPDFIAQLYPNLIAMTHSNAFPGKAVSAAPTVPEAVRKAVTEALLGLHEAPESYAALSEISVVRFDPAIASDYRGAEDMLKNFYGYVALSKPDGEETPEE
ncbi:MAG: PhnD/SsuA/transferrin family substrate-binding protein [Lysobacteraceae bacterium]